VLLPILDELAEILPDDGGEEWTVDAIVMKDAINSFLASLPKDVRIVFLQRYWYVRSAKEIARDLGLTESNVYVILSRTRKDFKRHLEKEGICL